MQRNPISMILAYKIILVSRSNSIGSLNTTGANPLGGLFRLDILMLSYNFTKDNDPQIANVQYSTSV